jgi:hypothetical protein
MYGLTESGLFAVVGIIGGKGTGEGQETGFGYQEAGNQGPMAGIGDAVTGGKIKI